MGNDYSGMFVYGGEESLETYKRIVEQIRVCYDALGYVPRPEEEGAAYSVAVGAATKWIAVFAMQWVY